MSTFTDHNINADDLMILIYAEIMRGGIAGHHKSSMNDFTRTGIKQIVTDLFEINANLENKRDNTDEDKEIKSISFNVKFTNIRIAKPAITDRQTGNPRILTPHMARLNSLTYSAPLSIDAVITATAYPHTGEPRVKQETVEKYHVGSMLAMVGSELCNTYAQTKDTLKDVLGEDPHDMGGFFISKGGEWCVDNLENSCNNVVHIYKNVTPTERVRAQFLSKYGDAFENSFQTIVRIKTNGSITVEVTINKTNKLEMPFYLWFRAVGMTADREICDHIVYGVDSEDEVTRQMLQILDAAYLVEDPRYKVVANETDSTKILNHIAKTLNEQLATNAASKDANIMKYANNSVLSTIDKSLFAHVGSAEHHRIIKMRFLGHVINTLLKAHLGIIEPSDRDAYRNKRIHAAGTSIAKAFKTNFNITIVQAVKIKMLRAFKNMPYSQVKLLDQFRGAINSDDLEKTMAKSITQGNKVIRIKNNEVTNRVSSQTLYRKNDLNAKATMRVISTSGGSQSKQNERAIDMRRVHPTYVGFIDVSQSMDTGEKVGMVKQMASTCSVSGATDSFIIKELLLGDSSLVPLDKLEPLEIKNMTKVFVNGDWIGCCEDAHELVYRYRMMRREGKIHYQTTIVSEVLVPEVKFWTDVGRLLRPLIIVYNNVEQFVAAYRLGKNTIEKETVPFSQWIKLTKKHLLDIQAEKIGMDELRRDGIIEYISPEEQENTLIASEIDVLRANAGDCTKQFTHCDIAQAILGIVTLASPMPNHSSPMRITMFTNHKKQSCGWFALNWPYRMDKNTFLQYYCEVPLVKCFTDSIMYPNGHNCIVALAMYGAYNCEDSLIINGSSIDAGMFNGSFFTYDETQFEPGEHEGDLDRTRTMDINKDHIYEHCVGGYIKEGTVVRKNYVLITKVARLDKPNGQYDYSDKSIVYKDDEPAIVESIVKATDSEGVKFAKVKLRMIRPMGVGDKGSSRTGNKGIGAKVWPRCDMPYTEDGVVPDLIVNAHSIPTRMAVSQLIECITSVLAARRGTVLDATAFKKIDVLEIMRELGDYGIKYGGHQRMYNGFSGEYFDTLIFVGPTSYQRLQKFVVDESYAMNSGPTSALTRQPIEGRANDGGLRLGEMEKDVICAHGAIRSCKEKFYDDSDGVSIHICMECGNRAIINEDKKIYRCRTCDDMADIVKVPSAWAANLFFNEAEAMGVKMKFGVEQRTYPETKE